MAERRGWSLTIAVMLSLVTFVVAHQLTFLATYGADFAEGLASTGHGATWNGAVFTVLALCLVMAGLAAGRLQRLAAMARDVEQGAIHLQDGGLRRLARLTLRLWAVVFVAALTLFVVCENVEHVQSGLPAPFLSVLGSSEYTDTPFLFVVVSLVCALVGALYCWRRDILVARIREARLRWARASSAPVPECATPVVVRLASITGRCLAVRAPPSLTTAL